MGIIKNFLKPAASPTPALDTFKAHIAERDRLRAAIGVENKKHAPRRQVEAMIATLRGQIDEMIADANYHGVTSDQLGKLQRKLLDAEKQLAGLRPATDVQALIDQLRDHEQHTQRLLHSALTERLLAAAPGFLQAETQFRKTYSEVFALTAACDMISRAGHGGGRFLGWHLYSQLHIPRPDDPAFSLYSLDPYTAQMERDQEARGLDKAAEALLHQWLTGEAVD